MVVLQSFVQVDSGIPFRVARPHGGTADHGLWHCWASSIFLDDAASVHEKPPTSYQERVWNPSARPENSWGIGGVGAFRCAPDGLRSSHAFPCEAAMSPLWQKEAIAEVLGVPLRVLLQRRLPTHRLASTQEGR